MRAAIVAVLGLASCVVGETIEAEPDRARTVRLVGQTIDYFTKIPIPDVTFETLGLAPERAGTSDGTAAYGLDVPIGSTFFVRTAATDLYRPTVDDIGRTETADIAVFSRADINRQHVTAGIEVAPDTTAVFVELATFDQTPLSAFARTNLEIVDPATARVIAAAPFVVGPAGDVDPALDSASGAVVRFVFLDVPSGMHVLVARCSTCTPAVAIEQPLVAAAGVTLTRVTLGGVQGPPVAAFERIYSLFQRAAGGGLGCANCHTAGNTSPAFDGAPADVRDVILSRSLVDLAEPDRSLLLAKPLFEAPANHPNASFLSTNDPAYQTIRAWIVAGAN
ncbi:MAG: hypothetical protein ABI867_15715 [Kofleriaceae bacterium]